MRLWMQDVRYAVRGLANSPAFTLIVTVMLALGTGANIAVFSLLDETLYQRLPVRDPDALRTVVVVSRKGEEMSNVPAEFFQTLRETPGVFADVFASMRTEMNLDAGGDPERVLVQSVSERYYSSLGVEMSMGRAIGVGDVENGERPAVLSHRFWLRRFGGDSSVVGRTIRLNGTPATIGGVAPPDFFGLDRGVSPDVTVPLPARSPFANLWITVRMAPGVSDAAAAGEAQRALDRALDMTRPRLSRYRAAEREWYLTLRAALRPGDKGLGIALNQYREPLQVLLVLSSAVLLIACLNVANLLLARALARSHEFGVRAALGATRGRLFRHVLCESSVLAALGGVAGLACATAIHRGLVRLFLQEMPFADVAFHLNGHLLGFCLAAGAVTVLASGLMPAMRTARVDILQSLQVAAPGGRGRRQRLAKGLIVFQVAAALTLLVGSGLLIRSFRALGNLDTGVALDRTLAMRIALSPRETQQQRDTQIYRALVERVQAIPGVTAAALGWDFALGSGTAGKSIWAEGQPVERSQGAGFNVVGPGFFKAAGIPLLRGREFTPADTTGARRVVIVNDAFVRVYAAGRNPIGMHLGDEGAASIDKYEIVGVVGDSRTMQLRRTPGPMLYQPLLQDDYASNVVLHVRTQGDPRIVRDRVRAVIRSVDPRLPVYDETTLGDRHARALSQDRLMAALSSALGLLALALTAIGIYGVIAYSVGRRTAEIGIRLALGATAPSIRRLVVRETLALIVLGCAVGIPAALIAPAALRSMLFGVVPADPVTLVTSAAVLLLTGLLAGWLPARRAALLDPACALRR